jgi:hypothetical protein
LSVLCFLLSGRDSTPGSVNASKWVIDLMGGAWCVSVEDCANRAYAPMCYFGSSDPACFATANSRVPGVVYNDTMDFYDIPACDGARWCGGLMMNDPDTNPSTHDWNKVLVHYCDGTSYSGACHACQRNGRVLGNLHVTSPVNHVHPGNNGSVTTTVYDGKAVDLHFKGNRNLVAVVNDLAKADEFLSASVLVLTGDSAGGLGVLYHSDLFETLLPKTRVIAVPDSGYFLSYPSFPTVRPSQS